uniref:Uncharacterized protein n=1 Tax=Salarias fasciatus TaxID=181472 RepID=A0A672HRZ1_SALFA
RAGPVLISTSIQTPQKSNGSSSKASIESRVCLCNLALLPGCKYSLTARRLDERRSESAECQARRHNSPAGGQPHLQSSFLHLKGTVCRQCHVCAGWGRRASVASSLPSDRFGV